LTEPPLTVSPPIIYFMGGLRCCCLPGEFNGLAAAAAKRPRKKLAVLKTIHNYE
jgi:hypothetical protein